MPNTREIADLLQRGITAAQAGRKEEAHRFLAQVTELDERNEQAWLWLSSVVESIEDRRVCLENALAINPGNAHAQAGLRWLNQQTAPASATQEHCPRCQSPVPASGATCLQCGQVLIVACPGCGEYVDAKNVVCPECGQFLGDLLDGPQYHLALAHAYLAHRLYTLAQEAATRAEADAPDDPGVLKEVASLHDEIGNTDLAITTYERAIERDPTDAIIYARLGTIYRRRTMLAEARTMYEQAVERAGNDPAILLGLAQLYLEEEAATSQAIDLLERVVRLEPGHAEAHSLLGNAYFSRQQGGRAVQHYERAYELAGPGSALGQEVHRKLIQLHPPVPERQAQGWGETSRRVAGLMMSPALAALANARLMPWEISPMAWASLAVAVVGAYLWVCAIDVPRNPAMRAVFGETGVKGLGWKSLVGLPGALLWAAAFGTILWQV